MPLRTLTALLLFIPLFCFAQSGSIADQLAAGKRATEASKWDLAIESYRQARSAAKAIGDGKSESAALAGMAETEYGRSHNDLAEKLAAVKDYTTNGTFDVPGKTRLNRTDVCTLMVKSQHAGSLLQAQTP